VRDLRTIDLEGVMQMTGTRKTKLHELRKAKQFPMPAELPGRAVRWWLADVEQWLAARRAGGP